MKTVLITGASGGIGKELAAIFAKNGYNLVLVARSQEKLSKLSADLTEKYKIRVHVIPFDLSVPDAAKHIFQTTQQKNIYIDCLINNAGFGDFGMFYETSWEKENQMIDLNIRALTQLTKYYLQEMLSKKSGKIMNVASTAAFQPGPLMAVYYATKAYVLSFSEAISNELKGTGITVTALCPGPTASGFQNAADMNHSKLVKGKKMPSSAQVAQYGYQAMMKGKTVAIHGTMNKIMATSVRFTPRKWVTALVRKMSEKTD